MPEPVSSPGRRTTRKGDRPLVLNGRKRLITALSGFALAATIGFIPSTPAQAEPDIDDVQARVDKLYHEAEQASERYNDAKLELAQLQRGPRLARVRPGPPGRPGRRVRPQRRPERHHPAVPRPEPLRRGADAALRGLRRLPVPDLDDVRRRPPAGPRVRRLRHRARGARHPQRRDPQAGRPGRRRSRSSSRTRRPRSTTSSPRPSRCSTASRRRSARTILSRGSDAAAVRRSGLRPRRRRDPVRHGPGRRLLRLRRRRPERVRLLRASR